MTTRRLLVICAALALLLAGVSSAAAGSDGGCQDCAVGGDQGAAAYRGGLLIPPDGRADPPGLGPDVNSCLGCVWTLAPSCRDTAGTGDALCPGAIGTCPPGKVRLAVMLQRPTDPVPLRVGSFCHGAGEPLTPVELVPGVRDQFLQYLPRLAPSFQPRGRGIVNLPVLFATGEHRTLGRHDFALGPFGIVLDATTTWHWEFGDRTAASFTEPGGGYPDTSVSHTYGGAGSYAARVTATWEGEFWVDGAGPFQVTGPPITQTAPLVVPVREAGAVLIGSDAFIDWTGWPRPG